MDGQDKERETRQVPAIHVGGVASDNRRLSARRISGDNSQTTNDRDGLVNNRRRRAEAQRYAAISVARSRQRLPQIRLTGKNRPKATCQIFVRIARDPTRAVGPDAPINDLAI